MAYILFLYHKLHGLEYPVVRTLQVWWKSLMGRVLCEYV